MIHDWFMQFGGLAMVFFFAALFLTKAIAKRHPARGSDDKQANAFLSLFTGALGVLVLVVSFFLVCFGVTATIPGWIGVALLGAFFGLMSSSQL